MAIELIKDLLKIDQIVGKDQTQALVEGNLTVPDNKPNITKVLTVDGDVEVTNTKIVKDKVIVNGLVKFKVLYSADDELQPIHSFDARTDFREEIEIEGTTEEMIADIKSNIEHIDFELVDDSMISVKTVLDIEGKIQRDNAIDIVREVAGGQGVQVKKEVIKYDDIVGSNRSSTIIKEAFELREDDPDILDILRIDVKTYEKEAKVVDDKVIVAGVVEASIMYFGDDEDNQINYVTHEIPFTHFVEVPGSLKDMKCNIKLLSEEPHLDIKEDVNGNMRVLDLESVVKIDARVFEIREREITVDTYSTNKRFNIKKETVDITENIDHKELREVVKGTIALESDDIIRSVYNLNAKPIITDYRLIEGKVIIEGLLDVNALYLSDTTNEVKNSRQEIPFKSYVDMDDVTEGIEVDVENILEGVKYNRVNGKEIEVEATVKNVLSINRVKKISIVTEAEELEEEIDKNQRPSIIIYVVQKNDTLWDIAKRYNTTIEELIETNEILSPENIMPGEKIIIEKNIDFEM